MMVERLVGLYVVDDVLYQKYRQAMYPILQSYGGDFAYDFKLTEVLCNQAEAPMNRVFIIRFPSNDSMESFYRDQDYLAVRKKYFEPSVQAITEIAKYRR